MMEEVSDDTNGESSFEFVGGKSDDTPLKDDRNAALSGVPVTENYLFSTAAAAPGDAQPFLPSSQSQLQSPAFPMTATKDLGHIQFYDPAQHVDANIVALPSPPPPPPNISQMPSNVASTSYTPVQQGYVPPNTTPQNYGSPAMQQPFMEPQIQHSSLSLPLPLDNTNDTLLHGNAESGVWGWLKGKDFLNKVAEKAKNSVDSVITTLDPGMKEIINTGGDINVIVASGNEAKISAVREAFQFVFGKAVVQGIAVQSSSIAPQPVGFSAGFKAAEERIVNLRQQGFIDDRHILIAIENFLTELTPENWFNIGCLLLKDCSSGITIQVYTQAVPISSHYVLQAKDQTPADYPLGWSGYAITIGQIVGSALGVHHSEWVQAVTGVPYREMLVLAAKTLAGLYKKTSGR